MVLRNAWQLRRLEARFPWPAERFERLQFERAKVLLTHAYTATPYYRRLFDAAGFHPRDFRSLRDLANVPVTRRELYRRTPADERVAASIDDPSLLVFPTSGSSSMPLRVYMTARERTQHALYTLRAERAVGVRLHHTVALISPRLRDTPTTLGAVPARRWFERFGLLRRVHLDVWCEPEVQIDQLKLVRPDVLVSYPSHLLALAAVARQTGLGSWRPRFIFTNSEPLGAAAREEIAACFEAPVFQCYDAWETHLVGWECERRDGLHINSDHVIVEILEGNRAAPYGEVIVTNLDLFTMPIVRYSLGDIAERASEPCACGRALPRLRAVHGREGVLVRLPNGRDLPVLALNVMIAHIQGIAQFRIVQERIDSLVLEIVPAASFCSSEVEAVTRWIQEHAGDQVSLRVVTVRDIEPDASGKRAQFVSRLPPGAR